MNKFNILLIFIFCSNCLLAQNNEIVLLQNSLTNYRSGKLLSDIGAHTEYHFLHEAISKGPWEISAFRHNLPPSWDIRTVYQKKVLYQNAINTDKHWSPMVIAGNKYWNNYIVNTSFLTYSDSLSFGIVFRYQNDRCYYSLNFKKGYASIQMVQHATSAYSQKIRILAEVKYPITINKWNKVSIQVKGSHILAHLDNDISLMANDSSFAYGQIGLYANIPVAFTDIEVSTDKVSASNSESMAAKEFFEQTKLQNANPKPVLFKKFATKGFGVGRNLRFGDLDGDKKPDILIGQVVHHGPKDRNSELSCITAVNIEGNVLWQIGTPDPWKNNVTNDVAFQIHDINNDGRNEVIYCMNQELIIAEGSTGKVIKSVPTPVTPAGNALGSGYNRFPRILGDCLYFCDISGKGFKGDIIIKDRYKYLWALNNNLQVLWNAECNTGHYPWATDIDADNKDEILMGYTLFDNDGTKLWTLDNQLKDHADGVAIAQLRENAPLSIINAASDEGMVFMDIEGRITRQHFIGHVQNPAVANFRDDLPGLEIVSVNFWANQGIIHFFDSQGNIYHSFEPTQFGSMCLPINWTGNSEEFFVLNANVEQGGMFDGWGRCVVKFPNDGHPDMCYAVLDITGDCRDEVVVWDPNEIWIYTQDNNPLSMKLNKPVRNPLYNYSNYQVTISVPINNK